MESKNEVNNMIKYHEDIRTIKGMLFKVDEKPIFEPWFLIFNCILGFTAFIFHYLAVTYFQFSMEAVIFKIWSPIAVIGCALEPFAVFRKMSKESLPLFSRPIIKLYVGLTGLCISAVVIGLLILKAGAIEILPATIFCLFGAFLFLYGQVAYNSMFLQGFLMILTGLILFMSGITVDIQLMAVPAVYGLSVLIIVISEMGKEKNER